MRWCTRGRWKAAGLSLFFLAVLRLYSRLPSSSLSQDPDSLFGAPKVVVVFRDFEEAQLPVLSDSVRFLHDQLPHLDILVVATSNSVFHSAHLRFPGYDPIRVVRVWAENGTGDFNPEVVRSADYLVYAPPYARLTKSFFATLLDKYWQISSTTRHIGVMAVPLAGFGIQPTCVQAVTTGFEPQQVSRRGQTTPAPKERTILIEKTSDPALGFLLGCDHQGESNPKVKYPSFTLKARGSLTSSWIAAAGLGWVQEEREGCAGFRDALSDCCTCSLVWSGGMGQVLVGTAPALLRLPRPWLGPADLALSTQLFLFSAKSSILCPQLAAPSALPLQPRPPARRHPATTALFHLHLRKLLHLARTRLLPSPPPPLPHPDL